MTQHHLPPGTVLKGGRYTIQESISAGGFGITYKARYRTVVKGELGDIETEALVAVKEFFYADACDRHPDRLTVQTSTTSKTGLVEKLRSQFLKEARTVAGLRHPNIVRVLEVFEENGTAYMAMQFVEGEDLLGRIRRGGMDIDSSQHLMHQVLEALAFVHSRNTLHLDVKPANILCTPDNCAVLIDFGFAKRYDDGGAALSSVLVAKSAGYTPPEQYAAANLAHFSPAIDVYAAGATLYHCLTGQLPTESTLRNGTDMPTPRQLNPAVPEALSEVVMRAMSMDPARRYQTAGEMLEDLSEKTKVVPPPPPVPPPGPGPKVQPELPKQSVQPPGKPPWRSWLWGAAVVVLAVILGWWRPGFGDEPPLPPPVQDPFAGQMICISGGTFEMGSAINDDKYKDEKPVRQVTLSSYMLSKYEVTQAQWQAVMGNNPSHFKGCDQCPVENVSWEEAQAFLRKLNQMTGKNYRLPTEAEWEYAARGGSQSRGYKYAADDNINEAAWYDGNSGNKTHPVGTKPANELGLYDMSGNVWEWCADWYGDYPASGQKNPKGPALGTQRVYRGGSWLYDATYCRITGRNYADPADIFSDLGLRVAAYCE